MKQGELAVVASLSLGTVLLVGLAVGGGYLLLRDRPAQTGTAAPQPAPAGTLPVGNGVVAPVGPGSNLAALQAAQDAEKAREEAWRRADKINGLERDLATCHNEIKRLTDGLNTIDATPVDAQLRNAISDQEWASCRNSGPWLTQAARCHNGNMEPRIAAAVQAEWAARQAAQRRPLLVRLSELDAQQKSVLANLAQLGVSKAPLNVRTT
ncbi:hypothetical protein GO986_21795 [Deinococcus sp. HMF7620]|uniref:Uncharacterized protein n=1 Tax=Deinococcus arboris TaxID=2682977 RepID=A0A7C9HUG8_9DEIO|nr:hypothetical protein [Deinococcus arboris]MVN89372.1 hypothetical protein [Deinococcus arboris]